MLAHGLNFRIQPIVRLTLGQFLIDNQQLDLLRLGYPMTIANQHRNNSPPPERMRAMTGTPALLTLTVETVLYETSNGRFGEAALQRGPTWRMSGEGRVRSRTTEPRLAVAYHQCPA